MLNFVRVNETRGAVVTLSFPSRGSCCQLDNFSFPLSKQVTTIITGDGSLITNPSSLVMHGKKVSDERLSSVKV